MIVTLAFVVAVAAGVRGVWSPCGLSMLSTITPIGEQGRGHRYGRTAAWYIAGSTFGGFGLGAVLAGVAAVAGSVSTTGRALVVLVAAVVAAASDHGVAGFHLPIHHRQVNERWIDRYRPWVYGAGFGWQVGTGFATYIVTAANYLLVVLAAATASPSAALAAGTLFGVTRGLAVLLTRRARTPEELRALHRRVDRAGPRSKVIVAGIEAGVAVLVATQVSAWLAAGVVLAIAAACSATARSSGGWLANGLGSSRSTTTSRRVNGSASSSIAATPTTTRS